MSGLPKDVEREAAFFRYEFVEEEPATFGRLIAEGATVAVLSEATGGHLDRSIRCREMLRGYGCTDELRAVLWADGRPLGSAVLYRQAGAFW